MTCRELSALVVAYLDGELPPERATECRGHLRLCATCRAAADEHARLRDALVELPAVEPPPALWAQINARLGAEEIAVSERPAWQRAARRWLARLRPVLTPAALAVSAGAAALLAVHFIRAERPQAALAFSSAPVEASPTPVEVTAPPAPLVIGRDAADELAARDASGEARLRAVTGELLTLARAEVATWSAGPARRFARELERREKAILAAAPGQARDRAWHELTGYLERVALGAQVATR